MPSSSQTNLTPSLRCPLCQQIFRLPLDRLEQPHMCDSCCCALQVTRDQAGNFLVREEGAAAAPTTPAAASSADRTMMGRPAAPPVPSAPAAPARPTPPARQTAAPAAPAPAAASSADRTMTGKPAAPAAGAAPADPNRTAVGKPAPAAPAASSVDRTLVGKPVTAPTNGRAAAGNSAVRSAVRRSAAPAAGQASMAARAVAVRPMSPAARAVWLVIAAAAFLVPVAGASGLVVYKWVSVRGRAAASAAMPTPPPTDPTPAATGDGAPEAPHARYGGIEIASSSVKMVVVEFFPDADLGYNYKFIYKASSKLDNDQFGPTERVKAVAVVQNFFATLTGNKYGVPPDRIFITGSSALFNSVGKQAPTKEAKEQEVKEAKQDLTDRVRTATNKDVFLIDTDKEVELAVNGLVPQKVAPRSLWIDVGGGGVRGGGSDSAGTVTTFKVDAGVTAFQKAVADHQTDNPDDLPAIAAQLVDKVFREPLHKELNGRTELTERKRVYLGGGTVWALATFLHPEQQRGAYVQLKAADVDDFLNLVTRRPLKKFPEVKLPDDLDPDARQAADAIIEQMKLDGKFDTQRLVAGAEILEALSAELDFQDKDKMLFFNRYADAGSLLSYMGEAYLRENTAKK